MKIKVVSDFRCFKSGEVFDFTNVLNIIKSVVIVGENGCGKSSIFHALRGMKNDMKTSSLFETDFQKISKHIEVEHDYENIFYFDNVKDNGSDMMVAYDAMNFLDSGGFYTKDKSHGQSSLIYLSMFLEKLFKKIDKTKKTLVVLDEVDNGFSLKNMALFNNLVVKLNREYNCHVIVITHNPFVMYLNYMVYDFTNKEMVLSNEYIMKQTQFTLLWEKDREKLKEDIKEEPKPKTRKKKNESKTN